jgi:hypothetical protein
MGMVIRVTIDLRNVPADKNIQNLARQVGEVIRNITGSEVSVDIKERPSDGSSYDAYRDLL